MSWGDAAGRLRHGRRCAPGAGPLRVRDGSVRPEHVEGTFAGDAFVVYAGPGDDLGRARAVGYADLSAQRRGDASYGGSVYQLANGKTARLDDAKGPPYAVVADAGTGDDGQCRIYAYAPLDEAALKRLPLHRASAAIVSASSRCSLASAPSRSKSFTSGTRT